MHDWNIETYAEGWTVRLEKRFRDVWRKWHLNDMKAGTPAQEAHLEALKASGVKPDSDHYRWALAVLVEAGLQPDNGYSYGSKWLRQELPADVVAFLWSLPNSDRKPAWV